MHRTAIMKYLNDSVEADKLTIPQHVTILQELTNGKTITIVDPITYRAKKLNFITGIVDGIPSANALRSIKTIQRDGWEA